MNGYAKISLPVAAVAMVILAAVPMASAEVAAAAGVAVKVAEAQAASTGADEAAAADRFMGEYPGTYTFTGGASAAAMLRLIADGDGKYRAVLTRTGRKERLVMTGQVAGEEVTLSATNASGRIAGGAATVAVKGDGGFEGRFTARVSPTLGAAPAAGDIVLLAAGAKGKPPSLEEWTNKTWTTRPDGSMAVGKGSTLTRRKFSNFKLHLEFRTPYQPTGRGQRRGNSGVYVLNRYEVQILDSFGLAAKSNDCGGLYTFAAPAVNASLPPLCWQTYDITFRAARFAKDGKTLAAPPVITVLHNGIKIHEKLKVLHPTGAARRKGHAASGPILLQDHRDAVRYRNIWLVELKE